MYRYMEVGSLVVDLRETWKKDSKSQSDKRQNRGNTLATLIGKQVIVITRSGHWFYGTLRDVDNRGILITGTYRLEPKRDENGNIVQNTSKMVTVRRLLPFELPVELLGEVVVRKMFVAWGQVGQILRAKTKEEIEREGGVNG